MVDGKQFIIMMLAILLVISFFLLWSYWIEDYTDRHYNIGVEAGAVNVMIQQFNNRECYISNGTEIRTVSLG